MLVDDKGKKEKIVCAGAKDGATASSVAGAQSSNDQAADPTLDWCPAGQQAPYGTGLEALVGVCTVP